MIYQHPLSADNRMRKGRWKQADLADGGKDSTKSMTRQGRVQKVNISLPSKSPVGLGVVDLHDISAILQEPSTRIQDLSQTRYRFCSRRANAIVSEKESRPNAIEPQQGHLEPRRKGGQDNTRYKVKGESADPLAYFHSARKRSKIAQ